MNDPIHVTVQGDAGDPRSHIDAPPGVIVHRSPPLHPDDVDEIDGIPVTSLARTLVDLAEISDADELRSCFARHAPRAGSTSTRCARAPAGSNGDLRWRSSTA